MQEIWFDSWVGKIPWNGKWQPTPVFLKGAWQSTVHWVAKSQTRLNMHTCVRAHTHTHTHIHTHTCIKHQFSKLWWGSPSTSFKIFQLKPHGLILPCSSYPGFSHRNFFLLPQDVELGSSFLPSDFCISPLRLSASRSRCHEPLWQCGEADRPLLRIF